MDTQTLIITLITAITSSGVVSFVTFMIQRNDRKKDNNDALKQMVLGLGHEQLMAKCEELLKKDKVSIEEKEDLRKYLYEPYEKLGGNGTAECLFKQVIDKPLNFE